MVELLTSWLGRLKNADHVGLTTQIYDTVRQTEVTNDTYKTAVAALAKAIAKEDEAYKKTQKDWAVEELKTVDATLDAYMKGIRSIVSGHAALPATVATSQQGKELLQLWKEYDFKLSDSYTSEAAKVINMFQDAQQHQQSAEALGVWSLFELANKEAQKMQDLLSDRFTELSSRIVGELRDARVATDLAVKQLYQVLSSLQVLTPSETVTTTAKKLRAIEDYARVYYLKMTTSSGDDTPTETPDGSGGTNGGAGGGAGDDTGSGTPLPPPLGGGD